ncbi:MAG: serine acetyltransferase [Candidatus Coatesbacteria bacterium]|nr:serine acetyltransferase [Candidatus Coatesbacteria bacterium]
MKNKISPWLKSGLTDIIDELENTYTEHGGINHIEAGILPSRKKIIEIQRQLMRIVFPGYWEEEGLSKTRVKYFLGEILHDIYKHLSDEIEKSLRYRCKMAGCKSDACRKMSIEITMKLIEELPSIRTMLKFDVAAAFDGDPAAIDKDEIILAYPAIVAISTHRLSHPLYEMGVSLIPRIMSEYAHSLTGIDIHPGAKIGKSFFIDHGTGVVVGETTVIGDEVKLYQGVTIGALSFPKDERGQIIKEAKRHPTIEDRVTIYAGATILGGETVIGHDSVIGGNVWLIKSIPPYSRVVISNPDLTITHKDEKSGK